MKMYKSLVLCLVYYVALLRVTVYSTKVYVVNEEEGKDSYIGNVPQDFNLSPLSSEDVPRHYIIIEGSELVRVDNVTGNLYTVIQLDRETLCPDNPAQCNVNVEVFVMPDIYFQSLKVQLRIQDLNDNVPSFPLNPILRDISESAAVGTEIRLDSAIDPDLGKNTIQQYRLTSSPASADDQNGSEVPFFRLNIIENIDGTKIPQLILKSKLDREETSSYELLLYAIDGGDQAQTGTATVLIKVTDSNDNQPSFEQKVYTKEVKENVKPGYVVARLTATDRDEGHNARVRYAFPNYVNRQDKAIFHLNATTGVLSVKSPGLDYESKTIHHLTVEARDEGPNSNPAYATVTVIVEDVNDEPPVIDINFVKSELDIGGESASDSAQPTTVLVHENIAVGSFLAFVTVTDRDTGINGNVSCRLKDSSSFAMETLDKDDNRYVIRTKAILDREAKRYHNFEIDAWDLGIPSLSSSETRIIELVDENDNDPSFGKDVYHLSVKENVSPGSIIAPLKADDDDDGENARVTYSAVPLESGVTVPFTINPDTGEVIFVKGAPPLDAENFTGPFRLRVIATDNGYPKRNTSTMLEISVKDVNDNKPKFEQKLYTFRIKENEKVGHFIGSVIANDSDIDKATNGRITYSFVDGGSPFNINPTSGEIAFDGNPTDLDRETRISQPYVLTVHATDNGDKPLHDECTVEIFLVDVNDNAPYISYPNVTTDITYLYIVPPSTQSRKARTVKRALRLLTDNRNRTTAIEPKASKKSKSQKTHLKKSIFIGSSDSSQIKQPKKVPITLLKIEASDPDEGEKGRVHFVLAAGNDYNYFRVDAQSGNVTLAIEDESELRAMKRGCHVIQIDVKDMGDIVLESTTWVNIYVTNASPGSLNASLVLEECRNNTYYPPQFLPPSVATAGFQLTWWMILIIAVLVGVILIVVIVLVIVKYGCCGRQSNSYNCRDKSHLYGDSVGYSRGSSANGKKGSKHQTGNGTLDSRTSFVELPTQQEKVPPHQSDGSVHSRNSGKDSGTGDSMPGDYHNAVGARQPYNGQQYYPNQMPNYAAHQPTHVYLPPQDDVLASIDEDNRLGGQMYPRCTEECRIHGHSDQCWMPEVKQRPPSRMTPLHTGVEEFDGNSLKYRKRSMTPNIYLDNGENPRYVAPNSNTPYYYDPGSKFDDVISHPVSISSFRDDPRDSDAGSVAYSQMPPSSMPAAMLMHPYRQQGYAPLGQGPYARSPIPYDGPSPSPYMGPPQRGKGYLPSGGYDQERGIVDETHSNLSSTSGANRHPNLPSQSYAHPTYPQEQGYSIPYQPGYHMDSFGEPARSGPYEGVRPGFEDTLPYDDNFAATNLLSPAFSETVDFKHALERQGKQYQQNPTSAHNYQNFIEPEKNRKTSGTPVNPGNEEAELYDEKLGTIREELDADEVVAEIDGLLL